MITRRLANENDLPYLLALRIDAMGPHLNQMGIEQSDELHQQALRYKFECAEILSVDDKPVGLLKLEKGASQWTVIQLQIDRLQRGRGLGSLVLRAILAEADAANVPVRLSVLKRNKARRLYEDLGFQIIGEDAHEHLMHRVPAGGYAV